MTGFGSVPRHYLHVLEGVLGSEKVAFVQDRKDPSKDCLLEKVSVGIIGDGLPMARDSGNLRKTAAGSCGGVVERLRIVSNFQNQSLKKVIFF